MRRLADRRLVSIQREAAERYAALDPTDVDAVRAVTRDALASIAALLSAEIAKHDLE